MMLTYLQHYLIKSTQNMLKMQLKHSWIINHLAAQIPLSIKALSEYSIQFLSCFFSAVNVQTAINDQSPVL